MGVLSKKSLKRKLGSRLIYSPFLRLLLFNGWFQLAFGAMVFTAVFIALYLPKMWTSSPPDFLPVVKVSGLDLTQNWALKRDARKSMISRDYKRAAQSWDAAVAQNPGDVSALRGYLENTLNLERADRAVFRAAVSQMGWLLRLTHTNHADVELTARICEKFRWHEVTAYYLGNVQEELPHGAEAAYLKALFQLERMSDFQVRYERNFSRLDDPELPLYELALQAASPGNPRSAEAEDELERRSESGEHAALATRLHMLACGKKVNVQAYARSLQKLALRNEDTVADHAMHWILLSSAGRKSDAVQRAESFTRAPASASETVRLADAYYQLGMLPAAQELLERFAPDFQQAPEVWLAYAAVLEKLEDWSGMRRIALQIREDLQGRDTLWGYAYLLEGRTELAEKRPSSAERAFEKAAESTYGIAPLGLSVAKELTRLKFPEPALKIFAQLEPAFENDPRFWDDAFQAAFAARDAAYALSASEHLYRLRSDDIQIANRYAAALIINRSHPEEIARITLQVLARHPDSLAGRLNHAFALLLNQRTPEAASLLAQIDSESLSPSDASSYALAEFEINHNLQRWDEALAAHDRIARSTLFPSQRQWLREKLNEIPERQIARNN